LLEQAAYPVDGSMTPAETEILSIKLGLSQGVKSSFADFIRDAKSDQKKRVYRVVLTEATKQQNLVIMKAETKRA
jgi:hypothetical protein